MALNQPSLHQTPFLPQLLVNALNAEPDRELLRMADGPPLTAADVAQATSRYIAALDAAGLEQQARVGILSPNRIEVLHIGNACMLARHVIVPLHPMGGVDDYTFIAEDASLDAVIFDPARYADVVRELKHRPTAIRHFLSLGPCDFATDLLAIEAAAKAMTLHAPALDGSEVFRLSYSGGTTGKPKAIIGTHDYAAALLHIQLSEWEWPSEVRQLICTPISHAGAAVFMPTLMRRGSLVVLPGFDPVAVMEAIERHRITCVLLVPTMIYAILDHPRFGEFDLSSLETVFYGASSISPVRLQEAIRKLGPIFFQFYGQAEAPMTVCVLRRSEHLADDLERLASCGKPVPWVEVALLGDDGEPVADGTPGELCVRGSLVMAGYLGLPDLTEQTFEGGWLHTGDVARRDAAGFLYIVDRKKDMIVTGGFNVYPREVEDVLGTHPAVANCAVIGVPDDQWGEAVTAVVVLRPDAQPCAEELIALVRQRKGVVQAPKSVAFVAAIPLTPVGKPDKKALRSCYAEPRER